MSVAARVAREMGVKLGNEVSSGGIGVHPTLARHALQRAPAHSVLVAPAGWLQHPL